jgi:hypothetical protein
MFCPQCGQQQVNDQVRYCPRCGFQLAAVTGLLTTNGAPPATLTFVESPRRKGVRQGAMWMMIGIFIIPLFFIASELFGISDELGMIGLLGIVGGLLRVLYALFFEAGPWSVRQLEAANYVPPPTLGGTTGRVAAELPPAHSVGARAYTPSFASKPDTAEIVSPPSVTEGTTRLLDEQQDAPTR